MNPGFVKLTETPESLKDKANQINALCTDEETKEEQEELGGFDHMTISLSMGSNLKSMIEMRTF